MSDACKSPTTGELHVWRVELPAEAPRGVARRALAEVLAGYLGDAEEAELSLGENGKPRLAREPGRLSFNLSHSGSLALIAIAPGGVEVGVDIELLRPRRNLLRLAERWLPPDDAGAIAAADEGEREGVFYATWTRHEARVKCCGAGLWGPAPGDEVRAWALAIDPGYAAAVALAATERPRIEVRDAACRG